MNLAARRDQWARFGIWRGLYALVLDALEKALDLHVFLVNRNPHTAGQEVPADVARTFEFRVLTADEVRRFARDPTVEMTPEFAEAALARGDYCFGVLHDGELAAYDWRGLGQPVPYDDHLDVHYTHPGQVYGYAMFTRPEYRGRRLQLYSLRCAETRLLAEGHTDTIGYVAVQNFASIRNLSRIRGQVFVGVAGYVRMLGRYITFRTPGAKRYGFRIRSADRRAAPAGVRGAAGVLRRSA